MVDTALSIGGFVGVLLSGAFVYWEVGKYATPQVPETLFDERKELFAYTAGLFIGVPLAFLLLFFFAALANAALIGAAALLAGLVGGTELAQWGLLRSHYFGTGESPPFYALGMRAAVGGILTVALVGQALSPGSISATVVALAVLQSIALIALEVAGALLSIRRRAGTASATGGPLAGAGFSAVGIFLVGFGAFAGFPTGVAAALVALVGALFIYQRLRTTLAEIPPPSGKPLASRGGEPPAYGRTAPRQTEGK